MISTESVLGSILDLEVTLEGDWKEAGNQVRVRDALAHIGDNHDGPPPHDRKRLIRLVLTRAKISPDRFKLALRSRPPGA